MKLFEVKGDIAKVIYSVSEYNLMPSDFLLLEDNNQKIISQITDIETSEDVDCNIATSKLVLSYDKDNNITLYNGIIPSKESKIIYVNPDEIMELIKGSDKYIYLGELSNHPSSYVKTSVNTLDKKLYIISDRDDKTDIIVKNFAFELRRNELKTIIIDIEGKYSNIENALNLTISDGFKLPLNVEAFDNIIENDLNDCPIEDKAIIENIIIDVREYIKTLKEPFLPFSTFKNVIDDEFLANPTSGLMAFRNKLQIYMQDKIFAEDNSCFNTLNDAFAKSSIIVIDFSHIKGIWHNYALNTIFRLTSDKCYIILNLDEFSVDKKFINDLYKNENVIPIISTSYNSQYSSIMKAICPNYLINKPINPINTDTSSSDFLSKINQNQVLLYGDGTLNLAITYNLKPINEAIASEISDNEIKKDVDNLLSSKQAVISPESNTSSITDNKLQEETTEEKPEEGNEEISTNNEDEILESDLDFLDEISTEKDVSEEENTPKNYDIFSPDNSNETDETENDEIQEYNEDANKEITTTDETSGSENIQNDEILEYKDDLIQEDSTEYQEIENSNNENDEIQEYKDDLTLEDTTEYEEIEEGSQTEELSIVDDDYYNYNEEEENSQQEYDNEIIDYSDTSDEKEKLSQEEIIAEELDIDDLKEEENEEITEEEEDISEAQDEKTDSDNNTNSEKNIKRPEINEEIDTKEEKEIPVYETDISYTLGIEDLPFKVGDTVFHPKHGKGVIEGFTNYSNKILFCQIDFEDVGRRILDPRIAGIKKVD